MINLPLFTIAKNIGGIPAENSENITISSVAVDSLAAVPGTMLFDYHRRRYPDLSLPVYPHARPCAVVTNRPAAWIAAGNGINLIKVEDCERSFWRFVDFYRGLFQIPVVGVTGTCGKTTTKEMIRFLLETKYRVKTTYKSKNGRIHNLKYLTDIDSDTEAGVFEIGVAAPGDMSFSCRFFRPSIGVFTNIGIDHLAAFRTREDYIREKGRMLETIGPGGAAVLNADDEGVAKLDLSRCKCRIIWYGKSPQAEYRITNVRQAGRGMQFTLRYRNNFHDVFVPLLGAFNVYNATAAIAAAHAAGIDLSKAAARLSTFKNVEKHFEPSPGINGSVVIDDTWSTNPTSATAALELLKQIAKGRKTIAVLGKMSLLGKQSKPWHNAVGVMTAQLGIDRLVVLGLDAKGIADGAIGAGMPARNVSVCNNTEEAVRLLSSLLNKNTVVLVKTTMLGSYEDLMEQIKSKGTARK